jgi:signal transduction histidine kinase/ActR/RegA family two-component response regulator
MLQARASQPSPPSLPPPSSDDPEVGAQVAWERVRALYEAAPPPVLIGAAFSVLVAVMAWPHVPSGLALGWLGYKLTMAALRLLDVAAFQRGDEPGRWRRWWRRLTALMTLDALGWSTMAILFLPHAQGVMYSLVLAGVVGVAAVGVYTTASHWTTGACFLSAILLPLILDQALQGGREHGFIAGALGLYLMVLLFESWRSSRRQGEVMRLRFQNARIAAQREQALALAEHSNAAKGRFLAAVSHEMRTPLNGILGMAQLLRADATNARQAHQLEVMRRSARHLQTVIADLLDLSRIELDRLEVSRELFAVADTVREVTDLLAPVASEKGLGFHVHLEPPLPQQVIGDAARIKQVLHNLLGNAIKFTRRGWVALVVQGTPNGLCFSVSDTGDGIPPAEAERVFDAFAQAGTAPARRAGTGLGLTIARHLARAMDGDVVLDRDAGPGAVFRFTVRAPHAAGDSPAAGGDWQALPFRYRGRVLVVDDSPVNAMVAQAMLERFDLETVLADDGAPALEAMRQQPFDLVLMDCQMPGMDGLEATARRRELERERQLPRTPIVAVTADAVAGDRERCLACGMDEYLSKPFDLNDLGRLLGRWLPPAAPDNPRHAEAARSLEP